MKMSVKMPLFSPFCAFRRKYSTPKVTIFYIYQCEKWTNKNQKTVEISKTLFSNCAKCYNVQKRWCKSIKKYVDISQKSVIIRV